MRVVCWFIAVSITCAQAEMKVPEVCIEKKVEHESVGAACEEIRRLVSRFEKLKKLRGEIFSVRQSQQRVQFSHMIEHISPIDGLLVDAWVTLYLDSKDSGSEFSRMSELFSISDSYSNQVVWVVFERNANRLKEAFETASNVLKEILDSELTAADEENDDLKSELEQWESQFIADKEKFELHVAKFSKIRSIMQFYANDAPDSPNFKAFGGFQAFKDMMMEKVRALDAAKDESSIASLQSEITGIISRLKRLELESKGIWRICRDAYTDIIDRPDLRVELKRFAEVIARQRLDINALSEHREYLKSHIVSLEHQQS